MVYPNTECYFLCEWMLTVFVPRLTGTQITLTNTVQAAALAQSYVTDQEWKDFCRIAQWRNPYYIVYRDYQIFGTSNLSTGLQNYYTMQGNSNDSVGGLNGTDNAMSYGTGYGKIDQGAQNNNNTSYIEIGSTSSFSYIQNTGVFGINFWFKPSTSSGTYRIMGSTNLDSAKGFYIAITSGGLLQVVLQNGNSVAFQCVWIQLSNTISSLIYHMITVTGDGTHVYVYVDNVLQAKVKIGTLASGNSTNNLRMFYVTTQGGSTQLNLDEVGFWNRYLYLNEVYQLWNGGAGITYPF